MLSKFPQDVTKTSFSISPDHPITLKYMALKIREGSSLSLKASGSHWWYLHVYPQTLESFRLWYWMGKKNLLQCFRVERDTSLILPLSNQACLDCSTCMNTISSLDKIHVRWPIKPAKTACSCSLTLGAFHSKQRQLFSQASSHHKLRPTLLSATVFSRFCSHFRCPFYLSF